MDKALRDAAVAPPPDTSGLSDNELEDAITALAANLNAATARWLALIAELDRREAWGHEAVMSCAHWLNWKCGVGLNAAREKVRVARALEDLPRITAAFAAGELSYSKVRAMTRVATPESGESPRGRRAGAARDRRGAARGGRRARGG